MLSSQELSGEPNKALDECGALDFGLPAAGTLTWLVEPDRSSETGAHLPALRISFGYPGVITSNSFPVCVELADPKASFDGFVSFAGGYAPRMAVRLSPRLRSGCSVLSYWYYHDTLSVTWSDSEAHALQTQRITLGTGTRRAHAISVLLLPGGTGRLHDEIPDRPLLELDLKYASDSSLWYSGVERAFIHAGDWKSLSQGQRSALATLPLTVILDPSEPPPPELLARLPIIASDRAGRIVPDGVLLPDTLRPTPTTWTWIAAPGARYIGSRECPLWIGALDGIAVSTLDPRDEPRLQTLPSQAFNIRPRTVADAPKARPGDQAKPSRSTHLSVLLLAQAAVAAASIGLARRSLRAGLLVPSAVSLALGAAFAFSARPPRSGFETNRLVVERGSSRSATDRGTIWNVEDDAIQKLQWPGNARGITIDGFGASDEEMLSCITSPASMLLVQPGAHYHDFSVDYWETDQRHRTRVSPASDDALEVDLRGELASIRDKAGVTISARWTAGARTCFNSTLQARPGVNVMPCTGEDRATEEDLDALGREWTVAGAHGNLCEGMDHALVLIRAGGDVVLKSTCLGDRKSFHAYAIRTSRQATSNQLLVGPLPDPLIPDRGRVLVSCDWNDWMRREDVSSEEAPRSVTIRGRSGAITIDREKGRRADPKVVSAYGFDPLEDVYELSRDEFRSIAEPHGVLSVTPAIRMTLRVIDEQ